MPFNLFKKDAPTPSQALYYDRSSRLTEFTQLEPNGRHGWSWVGTHPKTPYALHFVHVESHFEKRFSDVTHQFYIGARRAGQTFPLYGRQAKMDAPGLMPSEMARIVGSEMIKFFLLQRNPKNTPGLVLQIKEGQNCAWSLVFQDKRNELILKQLRRYHISTQAYLLDPDRYNAIKEPPPFTEDLE